MDAKTRRPFEGIRILDFTWVVAGPVATRTLADLGAEVIKIERRDTLDLGTRRGGFTGNLHRGKTSMVLNMADERGRNIARQLVAVSDVVIDNFSARVMHNWGMDYASLTRIKPDIIAVSMSGFGHTGPQKDYVSYGPTLQALSGYTLLMRHPNKEPAGWGYSYADMAGGYAGALAVLMALWHRKRTGQGQFVDLSQFETISSVLGPAMLDILVHKASIAPYGNRSQEGQAAPHGVYRCAGIDRWCAITLLTQAQWQAFCRVLDHPAWTQDERFTTISSRLAHQETLDRYVEEWTSKQSPEEVMILLQQAKIPAGVVANGEDLDRDPQLRARGYWAHVNTPEGDEVVLDGPPYTFSTTPAYVAAPGPLLGEHTDTVLKQILRYSEADIVQLKAERVIASHREIITERQEKKH